MKNVVGISSLHYEQVNTVFVEIENVKNSHSPTYMYDENLDES